MVATIPTPAQTDKSQTYAYPCKTTHHPYIHGGGLSVSISLLMRTVFQNVRHVSRGKILGCAQCWGTYCDGACGAVVC